MMKNAKFKRMIAAFMAVLLCVTAFMLTACGEKPSIVNTEEGKRLTAHRWQTNYYGHSEVRFHEDGSVEMYPPTLEDTPEKVDGKWALDGTTLTAETFKSYDENGDLVDKHKTTTYTYADYMSDAIIDGGDQSIADVQKEHDKNGTDWYVSDKYLYFSGSVWYVKE